MQNPQSVTSDRRPDEDIEADVAQLVRSYSPLLMSRGYFTYKSVDGVLTIQGNIRTPQAKRVMVENAARIPGVVRVDESDVYDDEQVRIAVGALLPPGVYSTVHGGVVALTGKVPAGTNVDDLLVAVNAVAGVRRVGMAIDEAKNAGEPLQPTPGS